MKPGKMVLLLVFILFFWSFVYSTVLSVEPGSKDNSIELKINSENPRINFVSYKLVSSPDWVINWDPEASVVFGPEAKYLCSCSLLDAETVFGKISDPLSTPVLFNFDISDDVMPGTSGEIIIKVRDDLDNEKDIVIEIRVKIDPDLFTSDDIELTDDLVISYPNPVKLTGGYKKITFKNVQQNSMIMIYSIDGNLVRTIKVAKGLNYAEWYLDNKSGNLVSSGLYFYQIKTCTGEVKTGKIIILK